MASAENDRQALHGGARRHLLENQPRGWGTQQPASQSGRGGVPMFRLLTCASIDGGCDHEDEGDALEIRDAALKTPAARGHLSGEVLRRRAPCRLTGHVLVAIDVAHWQHCQ